jgi:protocatechuate 3,4-dioxygenase beta subunit
MRASRKLVLFLGVVAFLFLPHSFPAQDLDNVTITGKVTDQNGAVIPGASVTATLIATKTERTVVTSEDGNYRLIQLSPGVYNV